MLQTDTATFSKACIVGFPCREIAIPTRYDETTSSLDPIPYGLNVLKMVASHLGGHYRKLLESHRASRRSQYKDIESHTKQP